MNYFSKDPNYVPKNLIKELEEYEILEHPAFNFGDKVKLIDQSNPDPTQWQEYVIVGMMHDGMRYRNVDAWIADAPEWQYCIRKANGMSESKWVEEHQLTLNTLNLQGIELDEEPF